MNSQGQHVAADRWGVKGIGVLRNLFVRRLKVVSCLDAWLWPCSAGRSRIQSDVLSFIKTAHGCLVMSARTLAILSYDSHQHR
jgi:hypothetical protein